MLNLSHSYESIILLENILKHLSIESLTSIVSVMLLSCLSCICSSWLFGLQFRVISNFILNNISKTLAYIEFLNSSFNKS